MRRFNHLLFIYMRIILPTLFFAFSLHLPAQKNQLYDFMNEIGYHIADSSKEYYYLQEYAIAQKFDDNGLSEYGNELKRIMPEAAVAACLQVLKADTQSYRWQQDLLKRARVLDADRTQEQCRKIKSAWDEATDRYRRFYKIDTLPEAAQAEAMAITRRRTVADFLSLSKEEHVVYYLGRPAFDAAGEYAIVEVGVEQWEANSYGYDAVFKKVEGKWVLVAKINEIKG
jgi:hypothetical protein